jgi:HAD superfamily hydrolase (TIGR01459 family)
MASPMNAVATLSGLREIAGNYDSLICDIWGVVHDGRKANRGAIDALKSFRAQRGPVLLLTNAPRLTGDIEKQFDRIGVPHDCYDTIVTSGSAARADLERRAGAARPIALYHLGPERDRATHAGLNAELVGPGEAQIVLCTGLFDDEKEGPDDYIELLAQLKARDLLMICANPDVTVRRGDDIVYCAGALARAYEAIGGQVVAYGKPYPAIFAVASAELKKHGRAEHPLVVGDGLETDIRGANRVGLDALFVSGGLFGVELGALPKEQAAARLAALLTENDVRLQAVISELVW